MDTITDTTPQAPERLPVIRPERADGSDTGAIRALTAEAFAPPGKAVAPTSARGRGAVVREAGIIDALRESGALSYSLVAVHAGRIVGHAAASPVTLDPDDGGRWYAVGPVSVHPEFRRQGTGSALMRALLDLLVVYGASGVVLFGDPSLYSRFGFEPRDGLTLAGLGPGASQQFQALRLDGEPGVPTATVTYHPAFGDDRPER